MGSFQKDSKEMHRLMRCISRIKLQLQILPDHVVFRHLMEEFSIKKGRLGTIPQELKKMLVSQSYNRVMADGCSKMRYQQAGPLGQKEEGGEPQQH